VIADFYQEKAYLPNGSPLRADRYVWGQHVSGSLQGAGGVGGLLLRVGQPYDAGNMVNFNFTTAYCFLYDGNGNMTDTVHEQGAVMGRYRYDSFGNHLGATRTFAIRQNGVVHSVMEQSYGHGYYAPQTGRWINRDPIGERVGVNLYGFVGNDGVNGQGNQEMPAALLPSAPQEVPLPAWRGQTENLH
jgi:RHS repeat-associated protein